MSRWQVFWLFVIAGIMVLSLGHCAKVTSDCDKARGVVVRNNYDMPVCIEEGEH